jgi:hypothetical protein
MSMMDLQAALGGGGGPMPPPDQGAPLPGQEEPDPSQGGGSSLDLLQTAEDALHEFVAVDPDDADKAKASQALKIILDLKAANTADAREGGMKSLSRALAGA